MAVSSNAKVSLFALALFALMASLALPAVSAEAEAGKPAASPSPSGSFTVVEDYWTGGETIGGPGSGLASLLSEGTTVYDSTQAGCQAYHTDSPAGYYAQKCGMPSTFSYSSGGSGAYAQYKYERVIENMCTNCGFYSQVVSNWQTRCPSTVCSDGFQYSSRVLTPPQGQYFQVQGGQYDYCAYTNKQAGCSGGSVACSFDSQCGANGYQNAPYCSGGNVFDSYRTYKCMNPGATSSYCTSTSTPQQKQACTNGCTSGACNSGGGIACTTNSQCGINAYTGSPYCSGNSVHQSYRSYSCNNPGTTSSYCASSDSTQPKQTCGGGQTCRNGVCQNTQTCTDNDGDGYKTQGGTCGQIDCNDNDKTISPGLAESCNNRGTDDNCNSVQDEGCPALQNWVPRKWSNLVEYMRDPNYIGYVQHFSWDENSLNYFKSIDSSYIFELRRPDVPDVWDWWETGGDPAGLGCKPGYAYSNLPGYDASASEESSSVPGFECWGPVSIPIIVGSYYLGTKSIPMRNEEVEVETKEVKLMQPNVDYWVDIRLKRKIPNLPINLNSESEFCGIGAQGNKQLCEFEALSSQEDETHNVITQYGVTLGRAKKKFFTMSSIDINS